MFDDDEDEFAGFGSVSSESDSEDEAKVENCTGNGIYYLAPCQFGAPLAVSWPHFLYSQPAIESGKKLNYYLLKS